MILFATIVLFAGGKEASARDAWVVIDADTGRLLSGSNEHVRLPIASLTKIWTAFTVLESGAPLGFTTISPEAASAEGSSIYMKQGVTADVEGLLYGLMLRSGNDAAYALAEHAGGSLQGFVDLMNDNALLYGLNDTVFTNPSGLHNELHLSTAYDTALMMYHAMQNETFKKIASTHTYNYQLKNENYSWQNKHRLVRSNETAIAGKTGFTKMAGRTLVTYFEKDGKKIIVVTLNDGNDWNTHRQLSESTFSNYELVTVAKKGRYSILPGMEGELDKPIKLLLKKGEKSNVSHILRIPRGENKTSIGRWTVYFDNNPLITSEILLTR
ncbi:D-alanyl-D-alanine carboxypeptidase [Sporosarcina sp. Marseille-Q4063]|nr:D-alanyl-D-alanine carboxypeptidase [Sporosarcina sp. Marseille-Q4063]